MSKTKAAKGLSTADPAPEKPVDPMDDYEAQNHYDTLMKAHHIMNDPDKMKKVRQIAGRKAEAATAIDSMVSSGGALKKPKINSVADLKNMAKQMKASKNE